MNPTEVLSCFVPIEPKALKRHRDKPGGGKYDPSKQDKRDFVRCAALQMPVPDDAPKYMVSLKIEFHCRDRPLQNMPDLDNLVKLVVDAGNGIWWWDDRYIWAVSTVRIPVMKESAGTHLEISYWADGCKALEEILARHRRSQL